MASQLSLGSAKTQDLIATGTRLLRALGFVVCLPLLPAFSVQAATQSGTESAAQLVAPADKAIDKLLGQGYRKLLDGELAAAEEHFMRALGEEQANPWAALNLGVVYHRQMRFERARDLYQKAIANDKGRENAAAVSAEGYQNKAPGQIAKSNLLLLDKAELALKQGKVPECFKLDGGLPVRFAASGYEGGCQPSIADVRFPFAKAEPTPEGKAVLERLLPIARAAGRIEIKGFTDDQGGKAYNDKLAQSRARWVQQWLTANGIAAELPTTARGLCCYIDASRTLAARKINRRVEIHFPAQ